MPRRLLELHIDLIKFCEIATMNNSNSDDSDKSLSQKFLREKQAADYLEFSPRALQNWRTRGGGPKYVRISSRAVRYRLRDLIEWATDRIRSNTSEIK